jgi:hypothetical protein
MARHTDWVKEIPISSPSGGTASFSLLYILMSILSGKAVSKLLEIGVGKSTRLLVQYARSFDKELTLLDDDEFWLHEVATESDIVTVVHAKLVRTDVQNKIIQWYDCKLPPNRFDFLLIDGPMAYASFNRYNRLGILKWMPDIMEQEFIIIVDDSNRIGESLLVKYLMNIFEAEGISVRKRDIVGGNSQTIIATPRFSKYLYL